ncbi:bifunctional phosphopantothenoylcysteine decarboxylase/phosphopantothenate--cysteine ligase CoaBC [Thiotrichales bacterium 19S9-12]|nr:bifunctional phosphopantothenoylcysteine decarboxylase/phosphopantothenate--cysteine ligase CoaBC [Thiotrichales bacterium 19S9-11]MCF6812314.1 bifunctional phosphopantothenoylcysteine decarboxylase/phosphopantothenate--cysteine ligase CoaBC [Thiotrichales bacterium 19S9-12]
MNKQKRILLGITGGIAAYKSVELARLLVKSGHSVKVIMTSSAKEFIHPNTFAAVTGNPVYDDLFNYQSDPMAHIDLAKWGEYLIIAPATASSIAKIAHGLADDLLSTIVLATKASILIAPAMNKVMWENVIVQENLEKIKSLGYEIIGPQEGEQACGDIGMGRMSEASSIYQVFSKLIFNSSPNEVGPWQGKRVVMTAGPTEETIDPVRFLSNRSSGKMGYCLAEALVTSGADVTLISGPVSIEAPEVTQVIQVKSAQEMYDQVFDVIDSADVFIATAAVADYRMREPSEQKIKKEEGNETLTIELVKNPDILADVGKLDEKIRPKVVGFAAETNSLEKYAKAKLKKKNADMIVANEVKQNGEPFNSEKNHITVFTNDGLSCDFEPSSKYDLAYRLTDLMLDYFYAEKVAKTAFVEEQTTLDLLLDHAN